MRRSPDQRCAEATELAERAVAARHTLREAAAQGDGTDREQRALEYRALRCLRDSAGGPALIELFLKKRSWYRLEAAALFACRPEEVDRVLAQGQVSLQWIARHAPSGVRAYHFWYTQLSRNWPREFALLQRASTPGRRSGRSLNASPAEPANPAVTGGYNFFDVDTYEFAADRH